MNINQYAPKQIYERINGTLDELTKQSENLHKVIKDIDVKCTNYQFISENEIDMVIDTIRNYFLTKESCFEQCKQILSLDEVTSIGELNAKVEEHQANSLEVTNSILYYAYEFLKIKSTNVITDGLLQDHREKLNGIISSVLNEFADIEEVTKTLEPYKVALQYITKQLTDLTPYAELINNTFGAILFYNIVSGNNIVYDSNSIDDSPVTFITSKMDTFEEDIIKDLEEIAVLPSIEPSEDYTPTNEIHLENYIPEETFYTLENIPVENEAPQPIEPIEEPEAPLVVDEVEVEEVTEVIEEEDIQLELPTSEEVEEVEDAEEVTAVEETVTEEEEVVEPEEPTPEVVSEEVEPEPQPVEEPQPLEALEPEEPTIDVDYFEGISMAINAKYGEDESIKFAGDATPMDTDEVVNTFSEYVLSKQFACASLLLKENSQTDNDLQNLSNQYGVAVDDPCANYDYSEVFINLANEEIHPWLELSAILRAMFTCKNKEVECYKFIPYVNSIVQNTQDSIMQYLPNFSDILTVFDEIGYNTNYLIGIKLFDERNSIVSMMKRQAKDMLTYCEKTICIWNNHKILVATCKNLFSSSGGYVYNLIKEIYQGNFQGVTESIKEYCATFADEDGKMLDGVQLNRKVEEYLHEQLIVAKRVNNITTNSVDINLCYRNKFINRFTTILNFLFSYIERMNVFGENHITETNVATYRKFKATLIDLFNTNHDSLSKQSSNEDISTLTRAGMLCLAKTFKDVIAYMDYENSSQKYFYCELLKTSHFILDEMYIPYLDEGNNVSGFEVTTRIAKHLSDVKYVTTWKDALENHIKKGNVGNARLIVSYLQDTDQSLPNLNEYLERLETIHYPLEEKSNEFRLEVSTLYFNEVIPNRSMHGLVLSIEDNVKNVVMDSQNYGYYETFTEALKAYTIKLSEQCYGAKNLIVDSIGQSLGYDSDYYTNVSANLDSHHYSIADELVAMYANGKDFPNTTYDTSQLEQYDEIYSNFIEFCKTYANDLSSPNGYIFMNEFYNNTIKPIVNERFNGSYDCVKSDELIDTWVRGQGKVNVLYDLLTNIGFSIEDSNSIDIHNSDIVLSNSERKNSQPYNIPERAVFLNGIYNISQADRHISNLKLDRDTLLILDYALDVHEREHIMKTLSNISNGNRVVLADRCVTMYLTILPISVRKLAFKLCSLTDVSTSISCSLNFRTEYINTIVKDRDTNLLLGREYMGKTFIVNNAMETLRVNPDNVVISIDAFEDTMPTPELISQECEAQGLKVNPFTDWVTFETSMTRYLNKHPNKYVSLFIDNADYLLTESIHLANDAPIVLLKNLSKKFKNRFSFTLVADVYDDYLAYANTNDLTYSVVGALSYDETANMFEGYLNSSRISIGDSNIMTLLISKTFGCPEMVRLISKQVALTFNGDDETFSDSYMQRLTMDVVNQALSDVEFIQVASQVFLTVVIGSREQSSEMIPVVYAILYYLYEHTESVYFTVDDIQGVLNIFDLTESELLNVSKTLENLKSLGVVCTLNGVEYFLAHEGYKDYLGNKDFAFDMLDRCTRVFIAKEGVTQ